MSTSARSRAQSELRPPAVSSGDGRSCARKGSMGGLAVKGKIREGLIVVVSDDDISDPDYIEIDSTTGTDVSSHRDDNGHQQSGVAEERRDAPVPRQDLCQHIHREVSDRVTLKTPTQKTDGFAPGRTAALVRKKDTTLCGALNLPSTPAPSSSLDGIHSSSKTDLLVAGREALSMKDVDASSCRLPHTPPTVARASIPHGPQPPNPYLSGKISRVQESDTGIGTSQQKPNTTPLPISDSKSASSKASLSALPPGFPPAVKLRVYPASRPGVKRANDTQSRKLEAFGFVSAASLLPAEAKRKADTAPPVANRRNFTASAAVSSPVIKPEPVTESIKKPTRQEKVRILGSSREPLLGGARDLATNASATPTSICKSTSKRIKQEPAETQTSTRQPLPQTPQKPISRKRARSPTYSTGTYGDPYTISSDSDDGGRQNGKHNDLQPLKSFAELAEVPDTHETASDVEAVLNQFPAWLDSPSPSELGSSCLATPRSSQVSSVTLPRKILWDKRVANKSGDSRGSRRVRFGGEGDGFSSSPVRAKWVAPSSPLISCEDVLTSPVKGDPSPTRETNPQSRFASCYDQVNHPTRQITPTKRVNFVRQESPPAQQNTLPLSRLAPARQAAALRKCSPIPSAQQSTPRVVITISDSESDSELSEDLNEGPKSNSHPNHAPNPNPPRNGDNLVGQQRRVSSVTEETRTKKKRKRKRSKEAKLACRHRNRQRRTFHRLEREKVGR